MERALINESVSLLPKNNFKSRVFTMVINFPLFASPSFLSMNLATLLSSSPLLPCHFIVPILLFRVKCVY